MARERNPIVQLITRSRRKLRPDDPREGWRSGGSGAWKTLLIVLLVGTLTVAHLLGAGQSFPTLVDFLRGEGG